MEVDENRRQTSIQDYFFVKKSKKAATATRGAGEEDRAGSARGAPLRSISSNLSEMSRQDNAVQSGLLKDVGENARAGHRGDGAGVPCCRSKASTKRQYQQLFLDFGQRDFAEQQFCALCGMMVVHGVEEDIRQHEKICSDYKLGVPFHSDAARAVAHPRPDSAIYQVRTRSYLDCRETNGYGCQCTHTHVLRIQIRPGDGHTLLKKVEQVRAIVDKELGFVVNPSKTGSMTTFLYTRNKRVVGLCSVVPIKRGYVLEESNLERSRQPNKATIGIHQIWVHSKFRNCGIASALVDSVRERTVFGMVVPAGHVAYSSPSVAGAAFARRYSHKATGSTDVLVYDAC
jgi:ESCO1/2 acetyl-transferase/zinc-finger of acetyl-transferase ESCO